MNSQIWPSYDEVEQLFFVATTPISPARVQGMMAGMMCACTPFEKLTWDKVRANLPFADTEVGTGPYQDDLIKKLYELTREAFIDMNQTLEIVLADDEIELAYRLETLMAWCDGFLAGMMTEYREDKLMQLPVVLEILNDFSEIQNVSLSVIDSEANEKDFHELVEFVRVSALLVFAEYQQTQTEEKSLSMH